MSPRLRRMTSREVERLPVHYGFTKISQAGSHRKWRKEQTRRQVIVPEHRGKPLPVGTLRNMLTNVAIPGPEWMDP